MIPILYKADEKDFTTQGLGLLSDIQSVKVTEQRNAQYYLNMEMPVFSKLFKEIKLERLVKVDDHNDNDQLFRIKKIDTPSNGLCNVYAEHISRDIEGYTIEPDIGIRGSAQLALDLWRKYLVEKDKVTVSTDITTESKGARWLIDAMENPFYCLGGKEGSILELYGGEYRFDNLNVKLLKTRGFNTGASITYGRNMNDLTQEESIEELANSIYPFAWKDKEDGNQEDREMIVLDPLYVDGPHIDKYAERRVVFVDFTDKAPKDKVVLKKLAEKYVKDNNVGAPKVSMTVSPVLNGQIAKGLELEKFEKVNLCDIVTVKYYKLGIDVQAKVNEVTFDVLSQRFSEYKLGDEKRTLASSLGAIESNVNSMGKELQDLTNWSQQSADGKNTIFYGKDEPKANKTGDTWFKENPDGSTTIHVWDGQTWKEVKTDYTEEFEQLDKELAEQKEDIDKSLEQSEQAIKDSNLSVEKAEQAGKDAQKAIEEAGFANRNIVNINAELEIHNSKIDDIENKSISNGKLIEGNETSIKETIAKTDDQGKKLIQIEKSTEGLSTTVIDLKKDFENLELPARNLVRNSLVEGCNSDYPFKIFDTVEKWDINSEYALLLKGKLPDKSNIIFYGNQTSGQTIGRLSKIDDDLYYYYGKPNGGMTDLKNILKVYITPSGVGESCVDWIAVYKNDNKTKQWYPALEDNSKTLAKYWSAIEQNSKDIKTTVGKVDENGSKISQIEQDSEGIKTTVSELEKQKIGGRNLFRGFPENDYLSAKPTNGYYIDYNHFKTNGTHVPIERGINYTLTFEVEVLESESKDLAFSIGFTDSNGNYVKDSGIEILHSGKPGIYKLSKTFEVKTQLTGSATDNFGFKLARTKNKTTGVIVRYRDIKLEKGDKSTDWTPAPEDTNHKISLVEQTANGIKQTVQNKADKSEVTQLAGQITSVIEDNAKPNLFADSELTYDLNNLGSYDKEVFYRSDATVTPGNKNTLVSNYSKLKERPAKWNVASSQLIATSSINVSYSASCQTLVSQIDDGSKVFITIEFLDKSMKRVYVKDSYQIIDKTGFKQLVVEDAKCDKEHAYVRLLIQVYGFVQSYSGEFMLNEGNKAIGYRAGGISQSQITQTKEMILESIKDSNGKFTTVQKTIDGIQQTVQNKADQSQVTQLSGQITQTVEDVKKNSEGVSENKTQITQNKNMINMKVSKGDVVGQLNIEAGKTLIENKKVVIDAETVIIKGKSWMDGAVIKDASIGTAQIKNASITNAKIGSIDVGKLTSGTIKTGTINVESRMKVGENGSIESSYDYGDKYGETYNPRWFEGTMNIGYRYWKNISNVYDVTSSNNRGAFKYHTQTFYGPDMIKLRQYPNKNNSTGEPKAHLDITSDEIIMGDKWNSNVIINGIKGNCSFDKGTFRSGLSIGMDSGGYAVRTGAIAAPDGIQTLKLNYGRDLGKMELGADGKGQYIKSTTIWQRKYNTGDGRVVITGEGNLGTSSNLFFGTTFDKVNHKSMTSLASNAIKLEPFMRAERSGSNISYSAKEIEELGLEDLCYKDKDGNPTDMNPDKFIVVQMELIKELRERCRKLENIINYGYEPQLQLVASM